MWKLRGFVHAGATRRLVRNPHFASGRFARGMGSQQGQKLISPPPQQQQLADPRLKHREALLLGASSPWQRLMIKSKWALIKSYRPFNVDELSAFFSWFLLSHIIWIIVGTTTFVSLLIYSLNSIFAKEFIAKLIGKYISYNNDKFAIRFEDAIIPDFQNGMIEFKKVKIHSKHNTDVNLIIDSLKLTLSFKKWQDLRGLIDNVEIFGMNGEVITTNDKIINLFENKNYELNNVKISDSNIYLNGLKLSIFNSEIPKLRLDWLLFDIFNASNISGSVNDSSMFSIHKRQDKLAYVQSMDSDDANPFKRITRFKLDPTSFRTFAGLIDGPQFNWLSDGNVEIVADIMSPDTIDEDSSNLDSKYLIIDLKLLFNDLKVRTPLEPPRLSDGKQIISLDELRPILSYVMASSGSTSGTGANNIASIDPNSAGLASTHPASEHTDELQLSFRTVHKLRDLHNVSTLNESNLLDALTTEIYLDLINHVTEWEIENKNRRLAMWSKAVASQLLVMGIGAMA